MNKLTKISLLPFEFFWNCKVIEETEIDIEGISREVILFKSNLILGSKLIGGKIILNQILFEEGFENAKRNVFLHEEAHRNQKILSHLAGISQLFLTPPGLIIGFIAGTVLIFSTVLGNTYSFSLLNKPLRNLSILLSVYTISSIVSYIGEIDAQISVLNKLGEEKFLAGEKEVRKIHPLNFKRKLFLYLSHPPNSFIVRIHRIKK